jgi:ATP/maltotriose-dependent transcriptional regulator MalT
MRLFAWTPSCSTRSGSTRSGSSGLDALAALIHLWRGRLDEAVSRAQAALDVAADEARVTCSALDVLGRARAAQGRGEEAAAAFERWIRTARAAGLTALELQGLMELGVQEFLEGNSDDHLREARELAGRHGVFAPLVLADLCLLWWCGRRARAAEALAFGEEAVELCRRLSLDLLPHAVMALGWARGLMALGSGEEQVAEALAMAPGDVDLEILAGWMRGEWALRSGRPDEAADRLGRTTRVMHEAPAAVPPPAPFLWLCALVASGRREEANEVLPEVRSSPALSRQYVNRLWLAVGEALLEASPTGLEAAVRGFEDSAAMDVALAQELGAQVLGGEAAPSWLRGALETFERGGMETDAARVRRLLRGLGAPVPRARTRREGVPEPLRRAGVTAREAEVLSLVARGLSNRGIAEQLFLSPRTVQSHVSSLLAKLGVENRAGLVAVGLSAGEVGATAARSSTSSPPSRVAPS